MKVFLFAILIILLLIAGNGLYAGLEKKPVSQEEADIAVVGKDLEGPVSEETNLGKSLSFQPLSIPAYREKSFDGRDFTVGKILEENTVYTRYHITYKSGELTISGIMNVPKAAVPEGGFPVLFLNHGYIDPAAYTNGRGLKREQDYLTRRGYVVIHSDYRNHAQSDDDPEVDVELRFGYVEDIINAVRALKKANLPYVNTAKLGMLGHSMGGGITMALLVIEPQLVQAAALFAPVSTDQRENFERWTTRRPETAERIRALFGNPEDNPEFWDNVSPMHFLADIVVPIALHHGSADESVPVEWSDRLAQVLQEKGKAVEYYRYPGEPHEFTAAWPTVMERTVTFFDRTLKPTP